MTLPTGPNTRERVIAHLEKHPERDDYLASHENTRFGIAEAVGVTPCYMSGALRTMFLSGVLKRRLGRVQGHAPMIHVYFINDHKATGKHSLDQLGEVLSELDKAQKIIREMMGGTGR
jgi:hypothetical protein